jgi:hypothetical protein
MDRIGEYCRYTKEHRAEAIVLARRGAGAARARNDRLYAAQETGRKSI